MSSYHALGFAAGKRFSLCQQKSLVIQSKSDFMTLSYRILLRKEPEGGYTVIVPSLPGCVTYGDTIEESMTMAEEAIGLYIESLKEHNEKIY